MGPFLLLMTVVVLPLASVSGQQGQQADEYYPNRPQAWYSITPQPQPPPVCKSVSDICFVLDSSGSIRDQNVGNTDNWSTVRNFVASLIAALPIGPDEIRVGLVVFSDMAELEVPLGEFSDRGQLIRRVRQTNYRGGFTNTAEALDLTANGCFNTDADRPGINNIVIFISDGIPTKQVERTNSSADALKRHTERIISVGITNKIDEALLKRISESISGASPELGRDYFTSVDFDSLKEQVEMIVQQTCVEITPPPKPEQCFGQLDICFLIDSSGSIRDANPPDGSFDNWKAILDFVNTVVSSLEIGADKIRVGAVKFSDEARIMFYLNDFTDGDTLRRNISRTSYSGGFTNTADALMLTRTQCFNRNRGDREKVPNLAIVITDGIPTVNSGRTTPEANRLKAHNQNGQTNVIAIGITTVIDPATLAAISSPPQRENQNYFSSPDFRSINNIIGSVVSQVCEITVTVPACDLPTDIAFLVDASSRTAVAADWERVREYLRLAIEAYDTDRGAARVALVLYSDDTTTVFGLNRFRSFADINNAITSAQNKGRGSDIARGLSVLRTQIFTGPRGDRPDVRNVAVVLVARTPTFGQNRIAGEADALRRQGVELFAVGLTPEALDRDLNAIASAPSNSHVFRSRGDIDVSVETLPQLVPETCVPPIEDCAGTIADVVFVIDASGSIRQENFDAVLRFASSVIGGLDANSGRYRIGVATFSDNPREVFSLNRFQRTFDMQREVESISYTRGTTNTAAALKFARETMFAQNKGNRPNARDVLVVITDGASNDDRTTLMEAKATRIAGIHVITVGVGNWLDEYELEAMASYPTERNRFHVQDFASLGGLRDRLRDTVCDNVNECNSNPCQNGGTCRNEIGFYRCECRPRFAGVNCERPCRSAGDLVFVLDSSGSIGKENFDLMLDFVTTLVLNLDVDNSRSNSDGVRVALVTYSDDSMVRFNLGDHTNKKEVLNSIRGHYLGGTTNTAGAIKMVRERVFVQNAGDRPGVQNFVLVMTDGRSNNPTATWQEAMALRRSGAYIMVLGITEGVSQPELESIASAPVAQNVIRADDFQVLPIILDAISDGLCNNINECNPNPCNGAPCRDLINGYTCSPCPRDRSGVHCERGASGLIDLVFVIDASGSIRNERFPDVLRFIVSIISFLDVHPDRTRIGAISFSDNAAIEFQLNAYQAKQDVVQAIWRIQFQGGRTHTAAALRLVPTMYRPENGARETAARITIVFSDGNSNINPTRTVPEAINVKINSGVHMVVVSVGTLLNQLELEGIASRPTAANIFSVEKVADLGSVLQVVTRSIFDDRNECTSNPCRNGGTCLNSLQRFVCFCPANFAGLTCNRRCTRQLDVAFLLDLSGSVENHNRIIMEYARQVVYGLDMSFDRVRVAVLAFSDDIVDQFYLNTYQSKEAVLTALSFSNMGGKTNIVRALQRLRGDVFSPARGDRSGVRNIAILLSDGHSTLNENALDSEAESTRRSGVEVYAVSVGEDINVGDINAIASDPDSDHVITLRNANEIPASSDRLLDLLCA